MPQRIRLAAPDAQRLDDFLHERLPGPLSRSRVRALILAGGVMVDGMPVRRPTWVLRKGSKVHVDLPDERPAAPPPVLKFLYEDEDLLAVDKPAGLAMHANLDPKRPHLVQLVQMHLQERGLDTYLGIHQRLDLETSGVVVFTRSTRANPGIARQFEGREVRKTYHALTILPRTAPPQEWRETRPLTDPARKGGPMRVGVGGQAAETGFRLLRTLPHALLVEARPLTGRKHQIRAHLAASGMPLLGDVLYGGPKGPRAMLHAHRLELVHPVTGEPLVLESPYPEDFCLLLAQPG